MGARFHDSIHIHTSIHFINDFRFSDVRSILWKIVDATLLCYKVLMVNRLAAPFWWVSQFSIDSILLIYRLLPIRELKNAFFELTGLCLLSFHQLYIRFIRLSAGRWLCIVIRAEVFVGASIHSLYGLIIKHAYSLHK